MLKCISVLPAHGISLRPQPRSMDLVCDAPPNIETAPMGVGAEFQAEDWCTDGFNLAHAMVLMASYHGGIGFANSIYEVENEDNQDCDPLQARKGNVTTGQQHGSSRISVKIHTYIMLL